MDSIIEETVYEKIRELLKKKLGDMPYQGGERLKIDKNLLKKVIFSELITIDKKVLLLPGEVLAHIDLSEVSFDRLFLDLGKNEYLDLSHTNVSFVMEVVGKCSIKNCNLSNGLIQLKIKSPYDCHFKNCCLAGIDLNGVSVTISDFLKYFENVNLAQTKINIQLPSGCTVKDLPEEVKKSLKELIHKGFLDDCSINSIKILSAEEREKRKKEVQEEYRAFCKGTIDVVSTQLDEYKKTYKKQP